MRPQRYLRAWRVPGAIALLLVVLQDAGWSSALAYRRSAVLHGQVWRLVTGSFVHLGWMHLLRDLLGLFLIWGLFSQVLDERSWLWLMLTSSVVVGVGLLTFNPTITWYVGISGVLFGLFCAAALLEIRQRPVYAGALLLGMTAVIAWTLHAGALPGEMTDLGGEVVPQAHLYGAIGGAAFILLRCAAVAHWRKGKRDGATAGCRAGARDH